MAFTLLPEVDLARKINGEIVPALEEFHSFGYSEGIRWDLYETPDAKGSILIAHGFTESGFKFIEMVWYLREMGYTVMTVDHRGHGLSARSVEDNSITHIDRFETYVEDLYRITEGIFLPKTAAPHILFSHSMGGAVAAELLKAHPGLFTAAIFNAPMIRAETAGLPLSVTGSIAGAGCRMGMEKKMVFVHKIYNPDEDFESSAASGRARFDWYASVRRKNPLYQNSGASYGWLRETVKVCKKLTAVDGAKGIEIPTLFFCADYDAFVSSPAVRAFAAQIPHARVVTIPQSRHEIYRSGNEALGIYYRSIEAFLSEITE